MYCKHLKSAILLLNTAMFEKSMYSEVGSDGGGEGAAKYCYDKIVTGTEGTGFLYSTIILRGFLMISS